MQASQRRRDEEILASLDKECNESKYELLKADLSYKRQQTDTSAFLEETQREIEHCHATITSETESVRDLVNALAACSSKLTTVQSDIARGEIDLERLSGALRESRDREPTVRERVNEFLGMKQVLMVERRTTDELSALLEKKKSLLAGDRELVRKRYEEVLRVKAAIETARAKELDLAAKEEEMRSADTQRQTEAAEVLRLRAKLEVLSQGVERAAVQFAPVVKDRKRKLDELQAKVS